MKVKFYSMLHLKYGLLFVISGLLFSTQLLAQESKDIAIVSRGDFEKMDAAQKSSLIHQWISYSRMHEVPPAIEQKARAYYMTNHLDERIYEKYKILLKAVTNESLPVSNRLNACYFITENYDAAIFPVDVVREILNELILQSK